MIAGIGSKLQVGKQANWSTIVAQTKAISFTSENLRFVPAYKSADVLVGGRASGRMDIIGTKVEGDFGCIVYPDEIGLILAAVMGTNAVSAGVSGSAVYDHTFTPMSSVSGSSLPSLTITVDRISAILGYYGVKIDSMTLELKKQDYLRATFAVRGYDETTDTIDSLTPSTKVPFHFSHCAATIGGAAYDIESFRLQYKNNLDNDLFTMYASGGKMREIDCNRRELTGTVDVLYDSTSNTTRTNAFKGGTTSALVFTLTSTETAASGLYYTLTISVPLAYITAADPVVAGPEKLKQTFNITASENSTNAIMTLTLRNADATTY